MASLRLTTPSNPRLSRLKHRKTRTSVKFTRAQFTNLRSDAEINQELSCRPCLDQISSLCKEGQIEEAANLVAEMELGDVELGPEIFAELLQGCVDERDLSMGIQIHARILKNGESYAKNEYIETKLLILYAKCDVLDAADVLFCRMRVQNVFSWAAIIGLRCRVGLCEEALLGYCEMQENGILPDNFVVPNALKACGTLTWVAYGKGIHGYVEKMGLNGCVFAASSLVDMYGKCGFLEDARRMFNSMPERNSVAWNSMIVGYVQNGMNEEAINTFYDMRVDGAELTRVTVSSLLSAAANLGAVEEGMQGHAISILGGFELDHILGTSIINFYTKSGMIEDAEFIFDKMVERDVVTWNLLVSGYVQNGLFEKALNMCHKMKLEHLRFDSVTLASLLSVAAKKNDMGLGKEAHSYCIRNNLSDDIVVANSIIQMYSACHSIVCSRHVFDSARGRDHIMWNTLIAAYAELGMSGEALKLFNQMQLDGTQPNIISWNSLILGFLRDGQINEAKNCLSLMLSDSIQPNLLTWTTLISGLTQSGFGYEAIQIFKQMQEACLKPNFVSIISTITACRDIASLWLGRAIHGYVLRHNLSSFSEISTSLIDMYGKCGNVEEAKRFFKTVFIKDLAIYNAMISGHALHGQAYEALTLYKHLKEGSLIPDTITFTNVLTACDHFGLVDEAMEVFKDMVCVYNVKPSIEHYGCLVNLLCRKGYLEGALELASTMPYEPDARVLGSLLTSCREHREIELEEYLSKNLQELEPHNSGNYVALSNAYARRGWWNEVSKVRGIMKERGIRKTPGSSWVRVGGEIRAFVAGDRSHRETDELYAMLALLDMEM